MTSAVIAMLVSEGLLDYDRPVREYLPELKFADPETTAKATLADMLCHRTGLAPHDGIWPTSVSHREFISRFAFLAPSAPFGSRAQYSNDVYALAGYVAERVSGLDFPEMMKKYLFDPLGMTSTTCTVYDLIDADDHAEPFQVKKGRLTQLKIWNVDAVAPAASVNTTARDMCKWLQFLASGGLSPAGERLIAPETFARMTSKQIDFADFVDDPEVYPLDGYAFGWQTGVYRGKRILRHTGKIEGYSAIQAFLPEAGIGASLLVNFHSPTLSLMLAILYDVMDGLLGYPGTDWPDRFHGRQPLKAEDFNDCYEDIFRARYPKAEAIEAPEPERELTGRYYNGGYNPIDVFYEGRKLCMAHRGMKTRIVPYYGGLYKVEGYKEDTMTYDLPLSFIRDRDGEVRGLALPLEPLTADVVFYK